MVRPSLVLFSALIFSACNCTKPGVECAADAECTDGVRNRCVANECVQCTTHSECPSGACRADGTCAVCLDDSQCPSGTVCGPTGECQVGCADTNGSCPSGKYCLSSQGNVCVDCTLDSHCGPGRVCSAQNACVPGCSANQPQCSPGQVCDLTTGTCVLCTKDAHCSNGQVCDPQSHTCVQCANDSQCPLGKVCWSKSCIPGCNATHGCPAPNICDTVTGTCVQCSTDAQCGGTTPRCDPQSHTCKPCLPGASDNCPAGNYCRADFVCERGCKAGADCPSGVCLPNHSCQACTGDAQCAAGMVCDNGTCISACSATSPCGTGKTCCTAHCADTKNDVNNCGACGVVCGAGQGCCNGSCAPLNTAAHCGACGTTCGTGQACCSGSCQGITTPQQCGACGVSCSAGQFCDGTTCKTPTFPNFCANNRVYAIYDGIAVDQSATNTLGSTITQYCSAQTVVTYGNQTDPALIDQTTGKLVVPPPATIVSAGGPFPNKVVKSLERTSMVTKVYFASNGTTEYYFRKRSDNTAVSTLPVALCSPHRDHFVMELATDPNSGNLALVGYGLCNGGYGTQAAAYYWANVMLPNRASYPDSWYVYEWVDTNNDSIANAGDSFTKLGSGQ
jgi:Cys-rich repeat protein